MELREESEIQLMADSYGNSYRPSAYTPPVNVPGDPTHAAGGEYSKMIDPSDLEAIRAWIDRMGYKGWAKVIDHVMGQTGFNVNTLSVAAGRKVAATLEATWHQYLVERMQATIARKAQTGDEPLDY